MSDSVTHPTLLPTNRLGWEPTQSDHRPPPLGTLSGMDIAMSDEALEMVRSKGGTAAVDYIHAIG